MMRAWILLVAACSAPADVTPAIDAVTPEYGPLVGGTRIVIAARGLADATAPTRVFVGGREAPLANPLDDGTIEVIIPPGDAAGSAELIVINGSASAIATDRFRYSTEPAITSVSPADVIYMQPTTLTLRGSGFVEEGAGDVMVLVDGEPVEGVEVVSDTELRFATPATRPLGRPHVEVVNTRGVGTKERAFRYRPTTSSGLLLFPRNSGPFAIFYAPTTNTRIDIPRVTAAQQWITSVVRDARDDFRVVHNFTEIGRLDLGSQQVEQSVPLPSGTRIPAMERIGDTLYVIDRNRRSLGTLALDGTLQPVGEVVLPCCGSWGLAHDGATLWMTARSGIDKTIAPIDPATGIPGTPVTIVGGPGLHVEELRFFEGVLYATSRDGNLLAIDPETGATTIVTAIPRVNAMEVFD